jgi:hypothetical protein
VAGGDPEVAEQVGGLAEDRGREIGVVLGDIETFTSQWLPP